jgi:predicted PurR-regulated permease PerM
MPFHRRVIRALVDATPFCIAARLVRTRRSAVGGWPIAATLAVVAICVYAIRYALLPFVFAIAIAFVVDPAIVALSRRTRGHRWPGAILVYVAVVAVLGGAGYWVVRTAISDLLTLAKAGPQMAEGMLSGFFGPSGIDMFGHTYTPHEIVQQAENGISGVVGFGAGLHVVGIGVAAVMGVFLLLVLMPYFMISGPRLAAGSIWLLPPERRPSVERLLPRILPALRRYLIGVFLVVIYTAAIAWIGFGLVFALPHAPLLAMVVGLLEIIPVIGPLSSATLATLAGLQTNSLSGIIGLIAFVIALRLSIDNLFGPFVLGQAARVHPVVVIFAFVSGAMLFGAMGLILAVPTAVCLRITLQEYYAEPIARNGEPTPPKP